MRICTNVDVLLKFQSRVKELKNRSFDRDEIIQELAYEAYKEGILASQLHNIIDTVFSEKEKL